MLHQTLHKHHKKILLFNLVIFIISLIAMTSNPIYSKDMITGLAGVEDLEQELEPNILSTIAGVIFIFNIIFVIILLVIVRSGSFMIGQQDIETSFPTYQKVAEEFMKSILQTYSKFSEPHYTLYIFENLKKKYQDKYSFLNYIKLDILDRINRININVNKDINDMHEFQFLRTIQIIIDEMSDADSSGSFRTLLKYNLDPQLLKLLQQKGIYI